MLLTVEMCADSLMPYSLRLFKGCVRFSAPPPLHLPLSLTRRPHHAGSDRSDHVSQSHMSSFFFDTALLSPLLGILGWERMHHRRSISSDRNAAPRLGGRWRDEERKREEREGRRERERAGQRLVDILPGPKPQTDVK